MRWLICLSFIFPLFFLPACGNSQPSPEDLIKIQQLQKELNKINTDITQSKEQLAQLSGGLIKVLIEARLEILKTNKALVTQRIHSLESGAKITIQPSAITPNPEQAAKLDQLLKEKKEELRIAKKEAAKYSGGLIAAMKQSAVATQEQTIALLEQKFLSEKYGLLLPKIQKQIASEGVFEKTGASPENKTTVTPKENKQNKIVAVKLLNKKFTEQEYQEYIFFNIEFKANELDKPARAIKGTLNLQDIFGEIKFRVGWTINEPMKPGESNIERGTGFKFNQFIGTHQWIRATELKDMTASFTVKNILYQDGTRKEF